MVLPIDFVHLPDTSTPDASFGFGPSHTHECATVDPVSKMIPVPRHVVDIDFRPLDLGTIDA
jgi:hypothetical protein